MELSDLSEFGGRLLSPDDKTGMLYEIKDGKVSTYKQPVLLRRRPSLAVHKSTVVLHCEYSSFEPYCHSDMICL